MKLKKIASLALAGVMAVSMLAGCATKPAEDPTEEPVANSIATDLVASLAEDFSDKDYVTVATDATLQKNLEAVTTAYGFSATSNETIEKAMQKVDANLSTKKLPIVNNTVGYKDAVADHTVFSVVNTAFNKATTEYTVLNELADAIKADNGITDQGAYNGMGANTLLNALQFKKSYGVYTSTDVNQVESYTGLNFKYEIKVAATKVENTMLGEGRYVVAFTVTRTATPVATEDVNFGTESEKV